MKKFFFALIVFFPALSFSSDLKSPKAKQLADDLKATINSTVTKIAEYEKESGNSGSFSFNILQESTLDTSIGLVINDANKVVLVTPESHAFNLGIRSGDMISELTFNDKKINHNDTLNLDSRGVLKAKIIRTNEIYILQSEIEFSKAPGWSLSVSGPAVIERKEPVLNSEPNQIINSNSCGAISVFYKPPVARRYFPLFIETINDGEIIGGRKTYKVPPGTYKVLAREIIPTSELPYKKNRDFRTKEIVIKVESNKRYNLASKFNIRKHHSIKDYWEPVVWRQSDYDCEL